MEDEELLRLSPGINSWIVLREYAITRADIRVYEKLIKDYIFECPLQEWNILMSIAEASFENRDFQKLIEVLFLYCQER